MKVQHFKISLNKKSNSYFQNWILTMVLNIDQNYKFLIFPPDLRNPEKRWGLRHFGQYSKSLLEFNFEDTTLIFCSGKSWCVELPWKKIFTPPKSFLPPFLRAALAAWSWIAIFNFESYVCKNESKKLLRGGTNF